MILEVFSNLLDSTLHCHHCTEFRGTTSQLVMNKQKEEGASILHNHIELVHIPTVTVIHSVYIFDLKSSVYRNGNLKS